MVPHRVHRAILAVALIASAAASIAIVSPAAAATTTKTVTANVVHSSLPNSAGAPGNCTTATFYEWADVPGTSSASLTYQVSGEEASKGSSPPFDDTYGDHVAPPGRHRIQVADSAYAGPDGSYCAREFQPKFEAWFSAEGRVELTIEVDPAPCNAAKRRLKARRKAVNRLKAQVRQASALEAKRKLQGKLAKAKNRRAAAAKRVREAC